MIQFCCVSLSRNPLFREVDDSSCLLFTGGVPFKVQTKLAELENQLIQPWLLQSMKANLKKL